MPRPTDVEVAADLLGEPIVAGIWFSRFRHRWFHDLSTGTELDLLLVVLLFPFLLWHWIALRIKGRKKEIGPVFVAATDKEVVFFAGKDGIFNRHTTHVYDRRGFGEITEITFDNSKQTPVKFLCTESPDLLLYYDGPRRELEELVALKGNSE